MTNCDICGASIDEYEAEFGTEFHEDGEPVCIDCISDQMARELGLTDS